MPSSKYSWESKSALAWPILIDVANRRETISYKELGDEIGVHYRSVRLVLDLIQRYCTDTRLPPLTGIVVSKLQKRPGSGFVAWDMDDLDAGINLVYSFQWSNVANPFTGFDSNETFDTIAEELVAKPGASGDVYRRVKDRGMAQISLSQQFPFYRCGARSYIYGVDMPSAP